MYVLKNTGLGSISLSEADLQRLSDSSNETYITVSGGTDISVYMSLNNDVYIDSFTCVAPDLVDELTIYGSKSAGVWQDVLSYSPTTSGVVSSISSDYAFIRADVAPTSDLDIYGFDFSLEYPSIKFGFSASEDLYDVDKNFGAAQEILIRNDQDSEKDFYVFIDGSGGFDYLSISGTNDYGFLSYHEYSISLPDDFNWSAGTFDNTIISGTYVVLSGTETFGSYVSPVFQFRNDYVVRPFWTASGVSDDVYIDLPENVEGPHTIGVRLYNSAPTLGWSDGELPNGLDPIWAPGGTLSYTPYTNDQPLEIRYSDEYLYIQFYVGFYSDTIGQTPILSKLGVEYPTTITGVPYLGYASIYARVYPPITNTPDDSGLLVYSIG